MNQIPVDDDIAYRIEVTPRTLEAIERQALGPITSEALHLVNGNYKIKVDADVVNALWKACRSAGTSLFSPLSLEKVILAQIETNDKED